MTFMHIYKQHDSENKVSSYNRSAPCRYLSQIPVSQLFKCCLRVKIETMHFFSIKVWLVTKF